MAVVGAGARAYMRVMQPTLPKEPAMIPLSHYELALIDREARRLRAEATAAGLRSLRAWMAGLWSGLRSGARSGRGTRAA